VKEDTRPTYRTAVASDAKTLPPMARRVFTETFAHLFEPTAFAAFCDTAYGESGSMVKDLGDSRILWRIAEAAGQPVGYAKLRPWATPGPDAAAGALELQQIYVAAEWHGKGVARELMDWGISAARQLDATELYLTVFDHNERAKAFYSKCGFSEVGRCTFTLGGQVYDDRIWLKPL